jgi:hypothetical protein
MINPTERYLAVLPSDAHHSVALKAAVPGEAIHFALGPHAAAERLLSPRASGLIGPHVAKDRLDVVGLGLDRFDGLAQEIIQLFFRKER